MCEKLWTLPASGVTRTRSSAATVLAASDEVEKAARGCAAKSRNFSARWRRK
jgi:hypothetical protein